MSAKTSLAAGALYLGISQIVFMISGYIIHFWLGRFLGPVHYGSYGVIISLLTTINLIQTTGLPQSVSKYVSQNPNLSYIIKKKALLIQILSSIAIAVVYFLSAPIIGRLLNDASLVPYIRLSALVIPFYALYSVYVGYFNGKHQFKKQSVMTISYALAKLVAIVVLVYFLKLFGAILGFIIGPVIAWLLAMLYSRGEERQNHVFASMQLIRFAIPIIGFSVFISLIMSLDLFLVKSLLKSEILTGYYTAATTISRIPYFLLSTLALVLFPAISSSIKDGIEKTKSLIGESLRFLVLLLIPGTLLISATSEKLIELLYSSEYAPAASSLSILIFGLGFLTVFLILSNILNGAGRPVVPMLISLFAIFVSFILNLLLIPTLNTNGAAIATSISAFLAMSISAVFVYRYFKRLVSVISVIKAIVSGAIVYFIALNVSVSKYILPFEYLLLFGLYAAMLYFLNELKRDDFLRLKEIGPIRIRLLDEL